MFAATKHALLAHRAIKRPGIFRHRFRVKTPSPVLERVLEITLKRNIHHRRKVQVETKQPQNLAG